jgi:tetratricopeptide (TPR) repeat protein
MSERLGLPVLPMVCLYLGQTHYKAGRLEMAEEYFRRTLDASGTANTRIRAQATLSLGIVSIHQGHGRIGTQYLLEASGRSAKLGNRALAEQALEVVRTLYGECKDTVRAEMRGVLEHAGLFEQIVQARQGND